MKYTNLFVKFCKILSFCRKITPKSAHHLTKSHKKSRFPGYCSSRCYISVDALDDLDVLVAIYSLFCLALSALLHFLYPPFTLRLPSVLGPYTVRLRSIYLAILDFSPYQTLVKTLSSPSPQHLIPSSIHQKNVVSLCRYVAIFCVAVLSVLSVCLLPSFIQNTVMWRRQSAFAFEKGRLARSLVRPRVANDSRFCPYLCLFQ